MAETSAPSLADLETAHAVEAELGTLSLEELWMPFTANRAFKRAPRLLVEAKGMYYTAADGRRGAADLRAERGRTDVSWWPESD